MRLWRGCAQADPEAAAVRMRYHKSPFEVLGCRVPVINEAAHLADTPALIAALGRPAK